MLQETANVLKSSSRQLVISLGQWVILFDSFLYREIGTGVMKFDACCAVVIDCPNKFNIGWLYLLTT